MTAGERWFVGLPWKLRRYALFARWLAKNRPETEGTACRWSPPMKQGDPGDESAWDPAECGSA